MNKISIILPFKNPGDFFTECLRSIQNQTHTNWELIAINDHSGDHSLEIIQQFSKNDQRISVLQNQGTGIIAALQTTQPFITGEFVTRIDADDLMPADRLEKMLKAMVDSANGTVVTGLVKYFSEDPISPGYQEYEKWINDMNLQNKQWDNIYRECVIASPNWLIRKPDFDKSNGFMNLRYPEDYDLVMKWYAQGFNIITVPEVTLLWREHPKRTSRNSDHYNQKSFFELKINAFLELDWKQEHIILWGENQKAKLIKEILSARKIPFIQYDLSNFKEIENIRNPRLLIAVYPEFNERIKIHNYLSSIGLNEGSNWWWV